MSAYQAIMYSPASPPPDYVTEVQEASDQGSGTTASATLGSTATSGNLLIAFFGVRANQGISTDPSGWTQLAYEHSGATNGDNARQAIYYKTSDGTETSVSASLSGHTRWQCIVLEYSGDGGSPVFDVTFNSSLHYTDTGGTSTDTHDVPAITTVSGNVTLLAGLATASDLSGPVSISSPSGWALVEDEEGTNGRALQVNSLAVESASAVSGDSWPTSIDTNSSGLVIAVRSPTGA